MKKFVLLVMSFLFLSVGGAFAQDNGTIPRLRGGIDYTYSNPEVFFTEPGVLKLSVEWEILNCFLWRNGTPVNQCFNLELVVAVPSPAGDVVLTSILEGTECLNDGCFAIIRLPLIAVLTPDEYTRHHLGLVVVKDVRLHLGFGGEEDDDGRIVGRQLADAYYDVRIVFNGLGFGSVMIVSMERVVPFVP